MRRHQRQKTYALLHEMCRKAMGQTSPAFSKALSHMASFVHPNVFVGLERLRKISISQKMEETTTFKGVYFGRFEATFPEDQTDWVALGWDGRGHFMMFPNDHPQTWVILHEFGHYLDDVYFRKVASDLMCLGYHPAKIQRFRDLKQEARYEWHKVHGRAKALLEACVGYSDNDIQWMLTDPHWYEFVPIQIVDEAPSRYGLITFVEWIAENFRRYCIDGPAFVERRCPETYKFLKFALSGEMFHRVIEPEVVYPFEAGIELTNGYTRSSR